MAKLGFDRDMVVDSLRKRQQNKVPRANVPNAQANTRVKHQALHIQHTITRLQAKHFAWCSVGSM